MKIKKTIYSILSGKLNIQIFVERVEPDNTRKKLHRLKSALLRQENSIIQRLSDVGHFKHIELQHIGVGFVSIVMVYDDPDTVVELEGTKEDSNSPLKQALRNILADKHILKEAGVSEVQFRTEISHEIMPGYYKQSKVEKVKVKKTRRKSICTSRVSGGMISPRRGSIVSLTSAKTESSTDESGRC